MSTSFDVQIWKISPVARKPKKGEAKPRTSYRVRWAVAKKRHSETFDTKRLAESFRAQLLTAARKGEAFTIATGLPASMTPKKAGPTWYAFAMDFIAMKWPDASPGHRRSTVDGLVTITLALTTTEETPPNLPTLRKALRSWAFNPPARTASSEEPPEEYGAALTWIKNRSRPLGELADPSTTRAVLDAIGRQMNGELAAPATSNRKRAALSSAIVYALERGDLDANPLHRVKVKRRQVDEELDTRVVVNHRQARALLDAIRVAAPPLEAFFGCIYYAAMRPSEVRNLRKQDLTLPEKGWGEAMLRGSYQDTGKAWTDDGQLGEERGLKHRARTAVRPVPLAPPLVALLRRHLEEYEAGAGGWLFVNRVGPYGHPLPASLARPVPLAAVGRALQSARRKAFTEDEQRSPLAARAYDLRHAAVSTWLAAGVPATQVAKWAGHSVAVLLKVYAHAIDGQEEAARRRIEEALSDEDGA